MLWLWGHTFWYLLAFISNGLTSHSSRSPPSGTQSHCQCYRLLYLLYFTLLSYMALNKVWSCVYEVEWSVSSECLKIPRKSQDKLMVPQPKSCWKNLILKLMGWRGYSWRYTYLEHMAALPNISQRTQYGFVYISELNASLTPRNFHITSGKCKNKKLPSLKLGCQWDYRSALREICVRSLPKWD